MLKLKNGSKFEVSWTTGLQHTIVHNKINLKYLGRTKMTKVDVERLCNVSEGNESKKRHIFTKYV